MQIPGAHQLEVSWNPLAGSQCAPPLILPYLVCLTLTRIIYQWAIFGLALQLHHLHFLKQLLSRVQEPSWTTTPRDLLGPLCTFAQTYVPQVNMIISDIINTHTCTIESNAQLTQGAKPQSTIYTSALTSPSAFYSVSYGKDSITILRIFCR